MTPVGAYPMEAVAPTIAALLGIPVPSAAESPPIEPVLDAMRGVARVALLGIDALGMAIWRHWRERMPFFSGLADGRLLTLRSTLPSITPVNFACMVTGAGLDRHGADAREKPIRCETLFDTARAAGVRSAALGRKGWSGHELLGRYADISTGGGRRSDAEVEAVLESVVQERLPGLIVVQYGLTDETFHACGPYSEEAAEACAKADAWARRCVGLLHSRGYGALLLADHGQHEVAGDDGLPRGAHGADTDEDRLVPLTWTRGPALRAGG